MLMPDRTSLYPVTPDGRYFVVRGRLWRTSNPALTQETRDRLVSRLMAARRSIKQALPEGGPDLAAARAAVDGAKIALGERGPPWWTDVPRISIDGWPATLPMRTGMLRSKRRPN